MHKAIFFDRDGIVNKRLVGDYVKSIREFEFLHDFFALFEFANTNGFLKIVISNQQGVAKGIMSETDLEQITEFMQHEIQKRIGTCFDDIYYSTDLSSSNSFRRKPNPGMILEAISKWNIDAANSWMIGDSIGDVIAGKRAGVQTILVGEYVDIPEADYIVSALAQCSEIIKSVDNTHS